MNDMRKWINLFEADEEGKWYTDKKVTEEFITTANQVNWWESFMYVPDHEYLYVAQEAFQKYMRWHLKPAWIVDVRITKNSLSDRTVQTNVSWKIVRGPEDPDDY